MKNLSILTFLYLVLLLPVYAQIPNSSFESWYSSNLKITDWVNTNGLMDVPGGGNTQTVFRSTDAHSGTYAVEMISAKVNNKPAGVFVPDYAANLFLGKQYLVNSVRGFPYTYRPANYEFWYKFKPAGADSANSVIILTRWDSIALKTDTISYNIIYISTPDSVNYKKAVVPITYFNNYTPDTVIILVSAITLNSHNAGTHFLFDDIALTGGNVGIAQLSEETNYEVYPNPVNQNLQIWFNKASKETAVKLYTMLGQLVLSEYIDGKSKTDIPVSHFPNGIYLLQITGGEKTSTRKILIQN